MRSSRRLSIGAVLAVLGAHNLIQNSVLNEEGYVTGNLVVSAALVAIGRRSGASWSELGLCSENPNAELRFGGAIATFAASGAIGAVSHPRTREAIRDHRWIDASPGAIWRRSLVRFPIGTAMFEEIAFRGVLPAVIGGDKRNADALSAAVFATWHLIPTARLQRASLSGWPLHRLVAAAIGGSIAAGAAGLALSWVRRRTGSLLAPWLVHASVNTTTYLAGVVQSRFRSDLSHGRR